MYQKYVYIKKHTFSWWSALPPKRFGGKTTS